MTEVPVTDVPVIDVNVYLSQWPFRRLPLDDTPRLVAKLRERGVTQAWAGSFEALLHEDLGSVNTRLAEECRTHGGERLLPMGSVNPVLPDWEEQLRRCHEDLGMQGIRLHPNFHGYGLQSPACIELLEQATARGMLVQIAVQLEDPRTQHPLMQVPAVDVSPLTSLLAENPQLQELRLILLNSQRSVRLPLLGELAQKGKVFVDIATQEGVGGVEKLIQSVPVERILFGSFSPFFYFEAAELKLRESPLGGALRRAIASDNAAPLVARIHSTPPPN
ncbi:amidohydrolase family protein [Candidatus Laterigemmans baculatus]|uniref:amidohydrolase family protein n=1 Tax=Candidatus Laterigemmans baculatus TaxID=2770505 RepID=UPI00193B8FF1|nr:amidohydrolase family protein [Candidatus Laterigemmans baculatus]